MSRRRLVDLAAIVVVVAVIATVDADAPLPIAAIVAPAFVYAAFARSIICALAGRLRCPPVLVAAGLLLVHLAALQITQLGEETWHVGAAWLIVFLALATMVVIEVELLSAMFLEVWKPRAVPRSNAFLDVDWFADRLGKSRHGSF